MSNYAIENNCSYETLRFWGWDDDTLIKIGYLTPTAPTPSDKIEFDDAHPHVYKIIRAGEPVPTIDRDFVLNDWSPRAYKNIWLNGKIGDFVVIANEACDASYQLWYKPDNSGFVRVARADCNEGGVPANILALRQIDSHIVGIRLKRGKAKSILHREVVANLAKFITPDKIVGLHLLFGPDAYSVIAEIEKGLKMDDFIYDCIGVSSAGMLTGFMVCVIINTIWG